ncbi:AMP dependent CoA ligase, putative, partial [Ricinus communis]
MPQPIEIFVAGASKLPDHLCNAYRETFGHAIHEGYGMTECAGFCTANPLTRPARAGSGGLPSPLYDVRVVQLDGGNAIVRDCMPNQVGSIIVRGIPIFSGYTDAKKTAEKFVTDVVDGERWLDSGDLGRFDVDGYLWVTGRAKDLIIRGGHNIDPLMIEEVLGNYPGIREAAAVGLPDLRVGELPIAFVETVQGAVFDPVAACDYCRDHIAERAAVPTKIIHLEALPRTAMNKVFKPELRRIAAEIAVRNAVVDLIGEQARNSIQAHLDEVGAISIHVDELSIG